MKKVVVVYPNYHETYANVTAMVNATPYPSSISDRTFEGKSLEVVNTDAGNLIIKEANGPTYAVFKHWIYWENIK